MASQHMLGKALLFIEEAWQAKRVHEITGPGSSIEIIAVSPEVCYALERAGLPFRPVENYYAPADVVALAFKVSHPRLDEICQYADEVIEATSPICRQEGLKPFSAHQHKLMSVLDSVMLSALVLTRVVEAENPKRLCYFPTDAEPLIPDLEFRAESIYSLLIPIVGRHRGIETKLVSQTAQTLGATRGARQGSISLPLRSLVPTAASRLARRFLAGMTFLGRVGLREIFGRVSRGRSGGPRLLVLDVGFDVDPVLECLYRKGSRRPIFWNDAGVGGDTPRFLYDLRGRTISLPSQPALTAQCAEEGSRCVDVLRTDPKFRALFEFEGVDVFPVVERRLAWLLERNLSQQLDTRRKAQALLSRSRVGGVLATDITSFGRVEVARAAREAGVPVIVYQHGGAWGYSHSFAHEIVALKWADYFLAYGDGVAACFNGKLADPGTSVRARSIPVGSTRLDAIRKATPSRGVSQSSRRRPRVVYVCHRLTGRNRRIPYCDYDSNRYWKWQKQILEVFRRHSEVEFIVRPFPSNQWHDPLIDYLSASNLANCRIETRRPFSSLVAEADLFLLDFDGTSMLEALTTQKPIIVFAEQESTWMHPPALELLEKRIVYTRSLEDYLRHIEEALSKQVWREPVTSDEFLRAYGTHLNDGRSAERGAAILRELMRKGVPASGGM